MRRDDICLYLSPDDRAELRALVKNRNTPRKLVWRAEIILATADEGQYYRMAGLNLLAAIIIYWNTKHLGQAVAARQRAGLNCDPALLAHISPLGWAHILLTGEYRWRRQAGAKL